MLSLIAAVIEDITKGSLKKQISNVRLLSIALLVHNTLVLTSFSLCRQKHRFFFSIICIYRHRGIRRVGGSGSLTGLVLRHRPRLHALDIRLWCAGNHTSVEISQSMIAS